MAGTHSRICLFICLMIFGIGSAASDLISSATRDSSSDNQLSSGFYRTKCPLALLTIKAMVTAAVLEEPRMGASLLRLHFHDCFVQVTLHHLLILILSLTVTFETDMPTSCICPVSGLRF